MILYNNKLGKLEKIKEIPIKLEKDIQKIIENNLYEIMGLTFVKSEFTIKDKRFDTLAYDEESNSFVIIEYKRDKSISVIDQGLTYLKLLQENKADSILELLELNERTKKHFQKEDIDWRASKVIFVASSFNDFQIQASTFKDLAIELWEVKQFSNNTILISQVNSKKSNISISNVSQNNTKYKKISAEIKPYTEEEHIQKGNEAIQELYQEVKNAILNLDDNIEIQPKKLYIAFKKGTNISDIEIQNKQLKIYLNAKLGTIDDPKHIFHDISTKGHWGNGQYQTIITTDKDIEYIMSVIKQLL